MPTALRVTPPGPGLHEITREVAAAVRDAGLDAGLCHLFLRHTSASLLIQENADPSARHDLERWLDRLVPEGDALYTHVAEGPDDMPAHVKAMLTSVALAIPVVAGRLALGTWQGIHLFEHRRRPGTREILVTLVGEHAAAPGTTETST